MLSKRMSLLHPYVPGEQPKDRDYIKLNANENPYPPSPEVTAAVNKFLSESPEKLGLYPDPDSGDLRAEIAAMINKTGGVLSRTETSFSSDAAERDHGAASDPIECASCVPSEKDKIPFTVVPEMIYTGNGSDEVLSFIFFAFFDGDRPLIIPKFSYSFYPVYCGFYNIPFCPVPLKEDWSVDDKKMVFEANKMNSGMIFANPNAPTGVGLSRSQIRQMLLNAPKDKAFVVDEAYADFGGESCIPLLSEFNNLIIVRTFSKSLCGAGMRSGYIVASPEVVRAVTTVKNSLNHFPVDAITQVACRAACRSVAYYVNCAKAVVKEREKFTLFLQNHGWKVLPSQTNFVFAKKSGVSGQEAYRKIKEDGILVRIFSTPGIEDFLRISIGTPAQMLALQRSMEDL
ncbi:aminotransferase class I/II-fold pyridoxal phosphate-dependent enzyme [Treponema parvum]|uniref:Aminotransferase class I/II-fold pyridoxal phosphate-dependent enzyme n=1 Tax=Treponema parvum TaxID=138851 RepID=A0A975F351_9SPIR|nr:histidinol-phosphate transaminase [Treponema parvum]QTQ13518.1 aminotransferase class I/II-fold pyridoxal phosphate-dependent enzyme [Treponema parvum]